MPNYEVDEAKESISILRKEIENEKIYYLDVMKGIQDDKSLFEE